MSDFMQSTHTRGARTVLTRRAVLGGFGAGALALAGCGGGGDALPPTTPTGFAASPMLTNLSDQVITATYTDLNTQATALLAAVQALAAAPTDEALMDAAQAQWRATRVPWESSEGFLFGPVDALGIDPAIDSWPLATADLQAFLVANPNATQTDVENATDDLRGFHAIEYLLFGDGVSDNDKAAAELTQPEANYLVALTLALQARTKLLQDSWTTSYNGGSAYATTLKTPGASNTTYSSASASVGELVEGLIVIADEVGNAKMAEPLGTSAATADTSQVESQYSWNSLTDFHNNLQSVMNAYTGQRGFSWVTSGSPTSAMNGLYAFVVHSDAALADQVFNEIRDAQQKIALIKGDGDNTTTAITGTAVPFRMQISNEAGRALIQTAIAACNTLQATLQTRVKPLTASTTFV